MKKLRNPLIIILSLLLLLTTIYLIVSTPAESADLEGSVVNKWNVLKPGVRMIADLVFQP